MKTSRLTRGIAGVAAAALAVTGAAFAVAPAAADGEILVNVDDIGPESAGYFGWHEGADPAAPVEGLWDGISIGNGGSNQILNGLVETGAPGLPITTAELGDLITTSAIWTVTGVAFTQVPVTWATGWATLRPADGVPTNSGDSPAMDDLWMSSKDVGSVTANTAVALSELLAALDAADPAVDDVAYSGFGFFADSPAVVQYMVWDGETYAFGVVPNYLGVNSTVDVTLGEIRPDESTYPGWHEGYDNATPAFTITDEGLSLGNGANSQILNGFAEPLTDVNLFDLFFSSELTVVSGEAFFQIPMFFGEDGAFTTLRNSAPVTATDNLSFWALDSLWTSSRAIGDIPAGVEARLGDFAAAFSEIGGVQILGVGVLAESPTVVESLVFNGVLYNFVPVAVTPGTDAPAKPELAATGFEGEMGLGLAGLMLMLGLGLAGTQLVRSRRAASSK